MIPTIEQTTYMTRWLHPETGLPHREDGPAIIKNASDGAIQLEWWDRGLRHRADGPAIIRSVRDVVLVERWFYNGLHHRADGPATVEYDGDGIPYSFWWFKHDMMHRTDGPSHECGGVMIWTVNGKDYHNNHEYQRAAGLSDGEMAAVVLKYGQVR